jgi:hypothetical protein
MENLSPRKSKKKWIFGGIGAILIVIVLAVALLPFYISSAGGRQLIVDKVNGSIDGKFSIADLSMGWFSGIKLTDVSFADNKGGVSATVKSLSTQPQYGSIIFGDLSFGKTVIDEPVIKIDLAKLQADNAAKPAPAVTKEEKDAMPKINIDLAINKGNFTVSDSSKGGKLVQLSDINTKLALRPTGQQTTFNLNLVAADGGKSSPVKIDGDITPGKNWQMVGTSGNLSININELDLGAIAGIVAMADPSIKAAGVITVNGVAKLDNGKITQADAKIDGRNLNISLPALKGDSFKTKTLAVTAKIATDEKVTKIEQLDATTDWAKIALKGIVPTTAKSLDDLLSPTSPTELNGTIDIDVAAVLSQMPHLVSLKEGMKINSGKLKGDIGTSSAAGGKMLEAKLTVSDVKGMMDGKPVALSKPIMLDSKIGSQKGVLTFERCAIDSAFAQANISGTMDALKYAINADLDTMQGELGQFVDFGAYKLGGQLGAKGNVAIKQKTITSDGSMTISQLAVASASGKATEPAASLAYKINLDQKENVLSIDSFKVDTSFANVNITEATVPMAPNSSTPMKLSVAANADIAKAMPWMVMAGAIKPPMQLGGMLDSTINITGKGNELHIQTDNTKITNLLVNTGGTQPPFKQEKLTFDADMLVNPVEKTYKIATFKISSPGTINIELLKFSQTNDADTTKLQGTIKADYDWQAVTAMAAPFLPAGLQLTGKRNDIITFNSQWPTNDPNKMLANMTGAAALGWQNAEYMGLQMGQTEIKANIEKGKLTIPPFTTTMNEGTLNFAANADFTKKPAMLTIPKSMSVLKNVQINDRVAAALLKNVNPLFANAKNTQGAVNLDCNELAIPLSGGTEKDTKIDATVSIMKLNLQSPVLEVLALLTGKNINSGMTLHPSQFVMRDGILRYDNMQIDLGDLALLFTGQMGPEDKLKMTVTLPGLGGIAFKGTKEKPQLDPVKMAELTLRQQLLGSKRREQTQDANQPQQQASPEQQLIQKGLEGLFKKKK